MSCQGIFGTPPEPVFNMKGCCLSSMLLEELLITQATCNEEQIQMVSPNYGVFKCGRLAGKKCCHKVKLCVESSIFNFFER